MTGSSESAPSVLTGGRVPWCSRARRGAGPTRRRRPRRPRPELQGPGPDGVMLIVTGSVTARPDSFEALRRAALDHVMRSRTEPGCVTHSVHIDAENPLRLFFYEEWADRAALDVHFAQE